MTILILTTAAVALAAGLVLWRDLRRRTRTLTVTIIADTANFDAAMQKIVEGVRRMGETIRAQMLPGLQSAAVAFAKFAEAYADADARWVAEHRTQGWQPNQREDA